MAEVPITINGVICDLYGRTITGPIKLVGSAMLTGLGVGGGPIIPPDGGGIQPPSDAHPSHPIALPGDPWWGQDLHPAHPIVIPPGWGEGPPVDPPPTGGIKPPPPDGGWGYHPEYGWGYFPGGGGKPQPPAKQPPAK